jgi:hypothetical protein
MIAKLLFWMVQLLFVISMSQSARAQTLPTADEFEKSLKACSINEKIDFDPTILSSLGKLYASENSRQALTSSEQFLLLMPESKRIEAYRLYADCVVKIIPQIATTSVSQTNPTYKVCTGEYERACQPHDGYLYCYQRVEDWAKSRCASYKIQRLNSYGGNKCGYSIDAVICNGPK